MEKKKILKNKFLKYPLIKKQKKTLLQAIRNFITKKGKKELSKTIFQKALIKASKKTKLGCQLILVTAFKRLQTSIEVKEVKRRRKFFKIPFFINNNRQRYLSIKWFFRGVSLNKNAISYSDKICLELISIIFKKDRAKSVDLKNKNLKLALANRANIHYRW
jgi:ribosomal protein S7